MSTEKSPVEERPFNQPEFEHIKLGKLEGHAYKFSLIIPMAEEGLPVFTPDQRALLSKLFTCDFDGCTMTNDVTHPLLQGIYVDKDGNELQAKHSKVYVYTTQHDNSLAYFEHLQEILEELTGEDEILLEMVPVLLVKGKGKGKKTDSD